MFTLAGSLALALLGVAPAITSDAAQAQGLSAAKIGDASAASAVFNYVAFEQARQSGEAQPAQPAASGAADIFSYVAEEQQAAAERPIRVAEAKAKDAKPASAPAASAASSKAKMVKPAPDDEEGRYYVGSEPCKVCHAAWIEEFKLTVMGRMFKTGKDTKQGPMECETCHGPASAHVNGGGGRLGGHIRSFRKADPRTSVADTNGVCLGCHENGDRTYWKASTHATREVACTDCHTVMKKMSPRYQLAKGNVMDTCFQCHKDRRAQMLRTAHMPMIEGKISCTSCHNPHGTASDGPLLKEATVNDTCFQCHADKRGPFLFEHPPVRENCLNCHEPHGSMHEKLLVVARPRLCQRCHTVPHNQAGFGISPVTGAVSGNVRRQTGAACLDCHTNIHGSNSPSGSRWHR
jgi:DmsE family decaheme c-type cytochrome